MLSKKVHTIHLNLYKVRWVIGIFLTFLWSQFSNVKGKKESGGCCGIAGGQIGREKKKKKKEGWLVEESGGVGKKGRVGDFVVVGLVLPPLKIILLLVFILPKKLLLRARVCHVHYVSPLLLLSPPPPTCSFVPAKSHIYSSLY